MEKNEDAASNYDQLSERKKELQVRHIINNLLWDSKLKSE
jgi:hypothetical protein